MKMKQIVACAAVLAASSVAAPAFAGATGNVGAFSDYVFRGITQTGSAAAVSGGLDYSAASGFYTGTWISTLGGGAVANYETDFYAGFAGKAGDLSYDIGGIYYYYRGLSGFGIDPNFYEVYLGGSYAGLAAKLYYSPDFGFTPSNKTSAFYVTGSYPIALSDSLALTPQVGYSFGDAFDSPAKEIIDYSLTLAKTLDSGFTFSFALTGTDRDGGNDESLVIGLKKSFDL